MTIPAVEAIPDQPKRTIQRDRPQRSPKPRPLLLRQALRLNRNLALYPLARDVRRKAKWRRSKPTGKYWLADLPGKLPAAKQMQIEMRLPADVPEEKRRAPTAVDVAVLFAVMAEVQAAGGVFIGRRGEERRRERVVRSVEWPSMTSLIKSAGLDPAVGSRARSQVRSALDYWQSVELIYHNVWRAKGSVAQIRHLPPPFETVTCRGRYVVIEVARQWRDVAAADGYYAEIPLPLPSAPAAQNLVLVTLSQEPVEENEPDKPRLAREFDARWLTKKIGLDSSRRNATLGGAIHAAQAWFSENGGDVLFALNRPPEKIRIGIFAPVRIPRRRTLTRSERKPPQKQLGRNANPKTPETRSERKPINELRVTNVTLTETNRRKN